MSYMGKVRPTIVLDSTDLADDAVSSAKIADTAVTSAKIADGAIVNVDVDASAAIALSKLATDPSNASNLASGTVPTARLGSGSASSSTFLRGDQTYAAAGGGKILQVTIGQVDEAGGQTVTTSGYLDSGLNTTIVPAATSSKIMLMIVGPDWDDASADARGLNYKFYKNVASAGDVAIDASLTTQMASHGGLGYNPYSRIYVDSPSTTSSIEYSLYVQAVNDTVYFFRASRSYQLIAMEIGA